MKALLAVVALLVSGGAAFFYAPPHSYIWLQPVAWVPAFFVIARLPPRLAFLAGWLVGAVIIFAGYYWIAATVERFSSIPPLGAWLVCLGFALASGFYAAIFAWGFDPVRRASGRWWPLGIAAWFTALEFLNPQLFPHFQGSVWYQTPRLFLVTAITGTSGVTFLVIFCNAVVLQLFEAWAGRERSARVASAANVAALLLLLIFAMTVSALRLERIDALEASADSLRVALVQPNHDVPRRREMRRQEPEAFANDLVAMSREAMREHPGIEVFVWPEGALTSEPGAERNRAVLEFAREAGVEIWTGANFRPPAPDGGRRRSYNSAYRIDRNGEVDVRYDKNILVPFGETMPLAERFPVLRGIRGPGDFARGDALPVYDGANARFAFLICYEAIQAGYVRRAVSKDPELLVNLTFDAWYGDTSEPHTHLMLAAVQAAQYGLPLLRSTTTGISAIVDARGLIRAKTGVFTREVLVADVPKLRHPTFYTRMGDWLPWSCSVLALGLLWRGRQARLRN
jgi:apolipoprotein N-acyltransferase